MYILEKQVQIGPKKRALFVTSLLEKSLDLHKRKLLQLSRTASCSIVLITHSETNIYG